MAAAARALRVDGTVLITVAADRMMSQSNEMNSIATEPRWRNMFVTSTLSTIMDASSGVLSAIFDGTALRIHLHCCYLYVSNDTLPITLVRVQIIIDNL